MIRPNHANFRLLAVARRTHNGVDFAPHPVVGLLLQAGDAEKFPQAPDNDGKGRQKRLIKNVGKVSPSPRVLLKGFAESVWVARGRKDKGYLVNYTHRELGHDRLKHGCREADFAECKQRVPYEDHLSFHPLPLPA